MADLSQRYGSEYPGVLSARADLSVARQQLAAEAGRIVTSMATQLDVARAHEAETKHQLAAARETGLLTADAEAKADQLQEEIDARHKLYASILQGLQQSNDTSRSHDAVPQVRVLSAAIAPGLPAGPKATIAAAIGLLGGLLLGMLLTVTWRRGVPVFESAEDATLATGLQVLATLPRVKGRNALGAMALAAPTGAAAEELRVLRMRMRALTNGGAARSVVFTSATRAEDGANIAAAFAQLSAADGERVLLIEGNLQPACLGEILGARTGHLLPVLQGKAHWRANVVHDAKMGLDLLLPDASASAPQNLVAGVILRNILIEAAEQYTLIILNGPPLALASNAMTIAGFVDVTVVVIDVVGVHRAAVSEAVSRLSSSSSGTIAAILVGLD